MQRSNKEREEMSRTNCMSCMSILVTYLLVEVDPLVIVKHDSWLELWSITD